MRDVALTVILLGLLPCIVYRPHVGLLAWAWVAFMNPHREVYGYLQGATLNFFIAGVTVAALVLSREKWLPRLTSTLATMGIFVLWTTLTTYTALDYRLASENWSFNTKTFILAFFVAVLIDRPSRLHALVLVIVISIGYWGAVNAIQILATLGYAKITGPPNSMITDNNSLALALVMTLPLVEYVRSVSANAGVRVACAVGMILMIVTILGTYSRGGLIALVAVLLLYGWRSKQRVLAACLLAIPVVLGLLIFPEQWTARMATIEAAQEDRSFKQRLEAWRTAIRIGLDRPVVGAGYRATENASIYARYNPDVETTRGWAVHSAYLQVLADHGFVGLGLFVLIFLLAILNCRRVRKACSNHNHLQWLTQAASMLEIGLLGFAVGGAALSVAYYDVFIVLLVVASLLNELARRELNVIEG